MDNFLRFLRTPDWTRQQRWRTAIWNTMARLGLNGLHGLPLHHRWLDIHHRLMPLHNLDPSLHGHRLVQISDLHYSPMVWSRYLRQCIEFVNELRPDLVVITGDLITGGYRYARRVAHLLAQLKSRMGVICTFGNHDYSMYGKVDRNHGRRRADFLEQSLTEEGLLVLRNEAHHVSLNGNGRPLVIVGLDDDWSGAIDAQAAFAGVDENHAVICLNHNPANCRTLLGYPWQWMLSGHTHGRALGSSALGKRLVGKRKRHFTHGYYSVEGRHLYVNKGLSYGQRGKHWCRPEVTVFELQAEPSDGAVPESSAS